MVITPAADCGVKPQLRFPINKYSKSYILGVTVLLAVVSWGAWKWDMKHVVTIGGTIFFSALMALYGFCPSDPSNYSDPRNPNYMPGPFENRVGQTSLWRRQLAVLRNFVGKQTPSHTCVFRREDHHLPRTIAAVCCKGAPPKYFALLKRKAGQGIVGEGSFKRGTYALDLHTLQLYGWFSERREKRSGKVRPIPDNEKRVHEALFGVHGLCTGVVIEYTFKNRGDTVSGMPKRAILVDLVDGDDLGKKLAQGITLPRRSLVPGHQHKKVLHEIAFGVNNMHLNGFMHLDLRPDNILIGKDGTVKIVDFSFSRPETTLDKRAGNVCYVAPEICWENDLSRVTSKADVWSFGMIMYDLSKGEWGRAAKEMDYKPNQPNPPGKEAGLNSWKMSYLPQRFDVNTLDYWIDRCMQFNPADRPTMQDLVNFLKPA